MPHRGNAKAEFKRTIKPIFFANFIPIFLLWGTLTDALTGNMYNYDYPLHVKLDAASGNAADDSTVEFRRKILTPPSGKAMVVFIHSKYTSFLFPRESIYVNNEEVVLDGKIGYHIMVLPSGPCQMGVSREKISTVQLDADSTQYYRLEARQVGAGERSVYGWETPYIKLLNLCPEDDVIRGLFTSYRLQNPGTFK